MPERFITKTRDCGNRWDACHLHICEGLVTFSLMRFFLAVAADPGFPEGENEKKKGHLPCGLSMMHVVYLPLPPPTEWQTSVKTLPFRNFVGGEKSRYCIESGEICLSG